MRRLSAIPLLAAALLCAQACRRPMPVVDLDERGNQPPATAIRTADLATEPQLLSGFHQVEDGQWRWTLGKFSVMLGTPPGAAGKGATLEVVLSLPQVVIDRKRAVTLSAAVNNTPLAPERFEEAGTYTYSRGVPPAALAAVSVRVDFTLDRYLASGEIEGRELGLIVRSIALK